MNHFPFGVSEASRFVYSNLAKRDASLTGGGKAGRFALDSVIVRSEKRIRLENKRTTMSVATTVKQYTKSSRVKAM
jgi:hypothetical protein